MKSLFIVVVVGLVVLVGCNPVWENEGFLEGDTHDQPEEIDEENQIDLDFSVNDEEEGKEVEEGEEEVDKGDEEIQAGLMENLDLFEGDIENVNASDLEGRNAINNPTRKWDKRVIPFVISNQYSRNARNVIMAGINQYHKKTCLRFVERKNQRDYVFIRPGSGCSSSVGRQGGRQDVSLGNGCVIQGIVVHELMHALGFWHEQSRPDRDKYVRIIWNNIPRNLKHNFMKFSHGEVDTLRLPYDIGSVMHYGPYDFAINRRYYTVEPKVKTNGRMGQRRGFSKLDVDKVRKLYRCDEYKNEPSERD